MHRRYLITQLLFSWSKSWWGHYTDCFSTLREDILPHLGIIHKLKKKILFHLTRPCFTGIRLVGQIFFFNSSNRIPIKLNCIQ